MRRIVFYLSKWNLISALMFAILAPFPAFAAEATETTVQRPITRDEIDWENKGRFYRMAALAAKETKKKHQAEERDAEDNFRRMEKLFRVKATPESSYREARYRYLAAQIAVQEHDHIQTGFQIDSEIADLNLKWERGEQQDLEGIAQSHLRRWENLSKLFRLNLKKAEALQDWAEWRHSLTKKLIARAATSDQELSQSLLDVENSLAEMKEVSEKIAEAEKNVSDSKITLAKVRKEQELARQ